MYQKLIAISVNGSERRRQINAFRAQFPTKVFVYLSLAPAPPAQLRPSIIDRGDCIPSRSIKHGNFYFLFFSPPRAFSISFFFSSFSSRRVCSSSQCTCSNSVPTCCRRRVICSCCHGNRHTATYIPPPPPSPKVFFPSCFRKVVAPSPHDADWPTEVIAAALRNVVRRHPLSSVCS